MTTEHFNQLSEAEAERLAILIAATQKARTDLAVSTSSIWGEGDE